MLRHRHERPRQFPAVLRIRARSGRHQGLENRVLLRSDSTLSELARVLERPKFDRYLTRYERAMFLQRFIHDTVPAKAPPAILASRDVRDNKFLELAVASQATCIITGDSDLLDLHPFRGIHIVTPAQFIGPGRTGVIGSRRQKTPIAWPGTT